MPFADEDLTDEFETKEDLTPIPPPVPACAACRDFAVRRRGTGDVTTVVRVCVRCRRETPLE